MPFHNIPICHFQIDCVKVPRAVSIVPFSMDVCVHARAFRGRASLWGAIPASPGQVLANAEAPGSQCPRGVAAPRQLPPSHGVPHAAGRRARVTTCLPRRRVARWLRLTRPPQRCRRAGQTPLIGRASNDSSNDGPAAW